MLFNSVDFAIFLPTVFALHWLIANRNARIQNYLLITASFVFYGWWDWRFLILLLFSAIVDYTVGRFLISEENQTKRRVLLWLSIAMNLSLLGFFKYYNFFLENFVTAFTLLGQPLKLSTLNITLPVGISFYTFQSLTYVIDAYKRKLQPTKDFISFLTFVCFFAQLVAGPIERAVNLLPQFYIKRTFDYRFAVDGVKQILWGLFKKIVIADNCASQVNTVFADPSAYSGSTLLLGAGLFAIQIYCDFSGYSHIAIGTAKLFGISLSQNFAYPYFSRNFSEFWRRWHISLSSWFRDYVYIPLGGNRSGKWKTARNIMITFLLSGFWHGAKWTFVVWGALHAIYLLVSMSISRPSNSLESVATRSLITALQVTVTFFLTVLAWIFFRADSLAIAFTTLRGMISSSLFSMPEILPLQLLILIGVFMIVEWMGRRDPYAIEKLVAGKPLVLRWAFYYSIIAAIFIWGGEAQQFIYFQF